MALQNTQKMSLMAQYDDLCRHTKVLTAGCEEGNFEVFKIYKVLIFFFFFK